MPGRILIYRFSSFGDVLIAIPVVMSALKTYPELSIVFVTRDRFVSYFPKHKRLSLIGLDLENEYKGLKGIFKAYMLLKSREKYELLIDLHNVIRSQLLNFLFRFEKISILKLEKRRRSKRKILKKRKIR